MVDREIMKFRLAVTVIKKDLSAVTYSSQFKFWVKKKHFELINHPALGVKDVLCLPAKMKHDHDYTSHASHIRYATYLHIYVLNTNDTTVMAKWRRVAFKDEFFDIIEEVHCRQKGHIGSKKTIHAGGKYTVSVVYAR